MSIHLPHIFTCKAAFWKIQKAISIPDATSFIGLKLLVLYFALRGPSQVTLVFLSPEKLTYHLIRSVVFLIIRVLCLSFHIAKQLK